MESLGKKTSRAVHQAVLSGGEPARRTADVLHGTWLGHPFHPALTDLVLGSWTLAEAFDLVAAVGGNRRAGQFGDRLTEIAAVSAAPTALAGLADYSTAPKWSLSAAALHAVINTVGAVLLLASVRERRSGHRGRGAALSAIGFAGAVVSSWIGGRLVYHHKVGVDHRDRFDGPDTWTPVLAWSDLPDRTPTRADWKTRGVLLYREGDEIFAIADKCAHAGGPLHKGKVRNCTVECPWHQSVYDLRDGSLRHGPSTYSQTAFEARHRNGQVEIRRVERKELRRARSDQGRIEAESNPPARV
ncbi:MAG TPA: Rieske 2Fe-2S domain-containing protein [Gemmatimonadales bacterium]|nr:Rieske 2Fe-2S domain-containing protein [Gemmatimonadales bacterium]